MTSERTADADVARTALKACAAAVVCGEEYTPKLAAAYLAGLEALDRMVAQLRDTEEALAASFVRVIEAAREYRRLQEDDPCNWEAGSWDESIREAEVELDAALASVRARTAQEPHA